MRKEAGDLGYRASKGHNPKPEGAYAEARYYVGAGVRQEYMFCIYVSEQSQTVNLTTRLPRGSLDRPKA